MRVAVGEIALTNHRLQGQGSHEGAPDLGGRPNSILRDAPTLCSPSAAPR
jgi:hypothetical protein